MRLYVLKEGKEKMPWVSVLDPFFPGRLPSLLSASDEELKEAFWQKLSLLGPKLLTLGHAPTLNIEKEFNKKDGGAFAPLVKGLRKTVIEWQTELLSWRVLRLFETPWSDAHVFEPIDLEEHKDLKPVIYTSLKKTSPEDMIGRMLGKHKLSLINWYDFIVYTVDDTLSYQKEWRWLKYQDYGAVRDASQDAFHFS